MSTPEYSRAYYLKNKEKFNANRKAFNERNPEYMREYGRKWRAANREKCSAYSRKSAAKSRHRRTVTHFKWMLKNKYGITPEEYNHILNVQGGACLICSQKPKKFHVDHDHKTGLVRGLLCSNCNTMLGMAKEDVKTLAAAIRYLQAYGQ